MSTNQVQEKHNMLQLMNSPTALTAKRKLRRPFTMSALSSCCHSENHSVSTKSTSRRSKSIVSTPEEEVLFRNISETLAIKATTVVRRNKKLLRMRSIDEKNKPTLSPIQQNSLHFFDEEIQDDDKVVEERYFSRGGALAISKPERVSATIYSLGLSSDVSSHTSEEYDYSTRGETSYTFSSDDSVSVEKQLSSGNSANGRDCDDGDGAKETADHSLFSDAFVTILDEADGSSHEITGRESLLDMSSTMSEAFTMRMSMLDDISTTSGMRHYMANTRYRNTPISRILMTHEGDKNEQEQSDVEEMSKLSSEEDDSGSDETPQEVKASLFLASSPVAKILSKNEEIFHVQANESSYDSIEQTTTEELNVPQSASSSDSSENTHGDETIHYVPGYQLGTKLLCHPFLFKESTIQNPEALHESLLSYSFSKDEYWSSRATSFESSFLSKLSLNDHSVDEDTDDHIDTNNEDEEYTADDEQEQSDDQKQLVLSENNSFIHKRERQFDDEPARSFEDPVQVSADENITRTEKGECKVNDEPEEICENRLPKISEVLSNVSEITTLSAAQAQEQPSFIMAYSDQFSTASTCSVGEEEDLEGDESVFILRAGRLYAFFQDRLDKDKNELVLHPSDKPVLEEVLDSQTCLPFVQALRKHLQLRAEKTLVTVKLCQSLGLHREGAQNPLFATLALENKSVRIRIPGCTSIDKMTCEDK
jgi:hypothetical protein